MNLSQKILILVLATSLVPLVYSNERARLKMSSALEQQSLSSLSSLADIQKTRVNDVLDQRLEQFSLIVNRSGLKTNLESYINSGQINDQNNLNGILTDSLSAVSNFKEISVLSVDGLIIGSTNKAILGQNKATSNEFLVGKDKIDVTIGFKDQEENPGSYLVGPIKTGEKLLGVLQITTKRQNLLSVMHDYTGLYQTGESYLVKPTNIGDALIITPLREKADAAFTFIVSKNKKGAEAQAISKIEGTLTSEDYRGEKVFAATRYIPAVGWGLVVKIDRSEVLDPAWQLTRSMFMQLFLLTVLIIGVSMWFAQLLSRPIIRLRQAAQELKIGNLSARIPVTSKDEIGELTRAFNDMAIDNEIALNLLRDKAKELKGARSSNDKLAVTVEEIEKRLGSITKDSEYLLMKKELEEIKSKLPKT